MITLKTIIFYQNLNVNEQLFWFIKNIIILSTITRAITGKCDTLK